MGTIQIDGSTPKLTIGNATAEDATILFDGNAQDFYIALDDSADDLLIGLGSTVGTTPMLSFTEAKAAAFTGAVTMASTLGVTGVVTGAGFTAGSAVLAEAELELLDGLTAGTAIASKVVTTDASIDTSGQRNLTISGELDAATLDISGAVDIAGASVLHGLLTHDGGAVFNEASADVDFRVETGANTHTLFIDGGTDKVMINETVADFNIDAGGLCLNQAGGDNGLISFKSSDVAHGTTGSAETDTYALFKKNTAATGGLMIHCFSEDETTIKFRGYPTNDNTTQSGSGKANFMFDSRKKNGTSAGAHGANANLFCIQNDGNTRFIVDEDGDILHDGAISAYDSYDDAHLVRAMDLRRADPATIINSKWDKFVQYNYDDLKKTGILGHLSAKEEAEGQKPFIKMGALQRLHNGAIWQQYEKHNQLLDAVYELAKEAVGEEKANAILDKHEVKRLN